MGKHKTNNRVRAYKSLLEADRDWDYSFLLELERKKLKRMAKYFSHHGKAENNDRTIAEISLCVHLLDIVLDKESFRDKWSSAVGKCSKMSTEKIANSKLYSMKIEYTAMIPDFPLVNTRNAIRFLPHEKIYHPPYDSKEEDKYWKEHLKEEIRTAKAWHLYNIVREYKMFTWWD